MWIQTGITVRKRLSWVVTSVTLTFDVWAWPSAWTFLWSLVITPDNFMMIRSWEHSHKGVTDGQTDRRTENTIHRAAWSKLKSVYLGPCGPVLSPHDDVIKWKHFPRNWPFVREIHRSPVNFPHKGQWRGALMFLLIYTWINDWVNNREAGDLRRQHGHYVVIVMRRIESNWFLTTRIFTYIMSFGRKSKFCLLITEPKLS